MLARLVQSTAAMMVVDFDEQAAEQIIPSAPHQLSSHQGCMVSFVLLVLWRGRVNSSVGLLQVILSPLIANGSLRY
jgi:hypothetical protein